MKHAITSTRDRYLIQFHLLFAGFPVKALIGSIIAVIAQLFSVELELVVLAGFFLIADLLTGIIAAKRRGEKINSLSARQTPIKVIEYLLFVACMIAISNVKAFQEYSWLQSVISSFDLIGFSIVLWIELVSVIENVFGKTRAKTIIGLLTGKLKFRDMIQPIANESKQDEEEGQESEEPTEGESSETAHDAASK
ncbi:MAG: phage holin family protein [Chlorobi bacterium]|nr:phage holin family protein [Chlorobiota bacterium]